MSIAGGEGGIFPHSHQHMADKKWRQLSQAYNIGTGSLTSPPTGLALLCCSGEVQGLLSQQLVFLQEGRDNGSVCGQMKSHIRAAKYSCQQAVLERDTLLEATLVQRTLGFGLQS